MSKLEIKKEPGNGGARLVCKGRIVAGGEAESLNSAISEMLLQASSIELDLEHVTFLDSSGIGVLARQLLRARSKGKQLRIGAVSPAARRTLEVTNVLAQFRKYNAHQIRLRPGMRIVFIHPSPDISTFVAALLKDRGASVTTCARVEDARALNAADFDLCIVPADMDSASLPASKVLALPRDIFQREAEVTAEMLVAQIVTRALAVKA